METLIFVRRPASSITSCELTYLTGDEIDLDLLQAQHSAYVKHLQSWGTVHWLPELPKHPDGVFVEDVAVSCGEKIVITRPGIASRYEEVASSRKFLKNFADLAEVEGGGMLDGGDVLKIGDVFYVGASSRTDQVGYLQFKKIAESQGYRVEQVKVGECLHLKTGVTALDDETVLLNPRWVDAHSFRKFKIFEVDPAEAFAANCLRFGAKRLYPDEHSKTKAKILAAGFALETIAFSEFKKAEAGLTCCSLIH